MTSLYLIDIALSVSTQKPLVIQVPTQNRTDVSYVVGSPAPSPVPSVWSETSSSAPPPYQIHQPLDMRRHTHIYATQGRLEFPPFMSNPHAEVSSGAKTVLELKTNTGLRALFQAPVALIPDSLAPSISTTCTKGWNSQQPVLREVRSMNNLNSYHPRLAANTQFPAVDFPGHQVVQPRISHHLSLPPPYIEYLGASCNDSSKQLPLNDERSATRGRSLSQIFIYRPRAVTPSAPGGAVVYELDGAAPIVTQPTEVEISPPRKGTEPNTPASADATSLEKTPGSPEGTNITPLLSDSGSRRHELDSAAWQRRTRLFQLADPGTGGRDHQDSGVGG